MAGGALNGAAGSFLAPAFPCTELEVSLSPLAPSPAPILIQMENSAGVAHTRKVILNPGGSYDLGVSSEDPAELYTIVKVEFDVEELETINGIAGIDGTYDVVVFGSTIAA
jgi:hypothetical protein